MAPKKGKLPLLLFPSRAQVLPEPLGTVLIFGSWNFPISLTLDPLIGAISAGNTVVVKPSELAPTCSSLHSQTIPLYLDTEAVQVIEGGSGVAEKLLQLQWDKIFFTGSARVGRKVMAAAANNGSISLRSVFDHRKYSQDEIDEVRVEWANCVLHHV